MNQDFCNKCNGRLVYLSLIGPRKGGYTVYSEITYCPKCDDEKVKLKELKTKLKESPIKKRAKKHILIKRETSTKWWQGRSGGKIKPGDPIYARWSEVSDEILIKYYGQGRTSTKPKMKLKDFMRESDRENKIEPKKIYGSLFENPQDLQFTPPIECMCGNREIIATYLNETTPEINHVCLQCYRMNDQLVLEPDNILGERHPSDEYPYPPPCICGNTKYSIYDEYTPSRGYRKVAKCTKVNCRYSRLYYYDIGQWTDVHKGFKVKIRKNDEWSRNQLEEEEIEEKSSIRMEKDEGPKSFEDQAEDMIKKELKRTEKEMNAY